LTQLQTHGLVARGMALSRSNDGEGDPGFGLERPWPELALYFNILK
jgi:hypothetical protein